MAFKKTYMKYKKKAFGEKGVKGYVKKRYGGTTGVVKLARDVKWVMSRLNTEKKEHFLTWRDQNLGQVNGNNDGAMALSVTPQISQGVTERQRIGNEIRMTGASIRIQLEKQNQSRFAQKVRMYVVSTSMASWGSPDVLYNYLEADSITDHRDTNSFKNKAFNRQFKTLATKTMYLPSNDTYGATNSFSHPSRDYTFNLKLNEKLRWAQDVDTIDTSCRYYIIFVCDNGNSSSTVTNTEVGIPEQGQETGIKVSLDMKYYYNDN